MPKIAVVTDSNSGISAAEAKCLGIYVVAMPFIMNEETFFEGETLSKEMFYERMLAGDEISTSQPSPEVIINLWDELLKSYDGIVYIPMSSALSGSCSSAYALSLEYDGRVSVIDNKRISGTQRLSVLDALSLVKSGKSLEEITRILVEDSGNSTIYIMVDTLEYLKKGGRITPAAAALGTLLRLKPVLMIQGGKLDAFAKARTTKIGKEMMMNAIRNDIIEKFDGDFSNEHLVLSVVHSDDLASAEKLKEELSVAFPECGDILIEELTLSIATHIGPRALAIYAVKRPEGVL
ncbi:MAG: DegV family protein [Lachnospiraceae bacterium]